MNHLWHAALDNKEFFFKKDNSQVASESTFFLGPSGLIFLQIIFTFLKIDGAAKAVSLAIDFSPFHPFDLQATTNKSASGKSRNLYVGRDEIPRIAHKLARLVQSSKRDRVEFYRKIRGKM